MEKFMKKEITQELSDEKNQLLMELVESLKANLAPTTSNKEFLTRNEVASFFSISLVTLHFWMKKGLLKPYKMNRNTYFKYSEVKESLMKSNQKRA